MGQDHPRRRRPWSQPLADLATPALAPALARYGFDEAGLLLLWPEIVGPHLAGRCEPTRLQWARRVRDEKPEAATLFVRVESAFALDLQHQTPTVVERINAHYGWRCVGRLALRQGPVRGPRPTRPPIGPPAAASIAAARAVVEAVADEALRDALVRLGARVLAGS